MSNIANIITVARREFLTRVRTRSFIFGTVIVMVGVMAIAFVPIIVQYLEGSGTQKVAVWVGTPDLASDPVPTLDALLNAPTGMPSTAPGEGTGGFIVSAVPELAVARDAVTAGEYVAVLGIERSVGGDLEFTLYTNDRQSGRTAQLVRQASNAVAIADRLERLGVAPADQASVFAPASFEVAWPDPTRTDPREGAEMGTAYLLGFGMTILIFMMIVLYGNWVAASVVEEKSSRVMEVILNAATPFQLMAGKVLGVGSVALVQFAAILVTGVVAILAQGQVAELVLGSGAGGVDLPEGLTIPMLVAFAVYGVLGFLLYAVLYAAAGSLVSRQEDIQQVVMPLALLSTAGYIVAVYASTGLLDMRAGWMVILALVPFISPFLVLSRIVAGEAALWEIALSLVLLVGAIGVALWIAARIYAAGVLIYGQRPSVRTIFRLARTGM